MLRGGSRGRWTRLTTRDRAGARLVGQPRAGLRHPRPRPEPVPRPVVRGRQRCRAGRRGPHGGGAPWRPGLPPARRDRSGDDQLPHPDGSRPGLQRLGPGGRAGRRAGPAPRSGLPTPRRGRAAAPRGHRAGGARRQHRPVHLRWRRGLRRRPRRSRAAALRAGRRGVDPAVDHLDRPVARRAVPLGPLRRCGVQRRAHRPAGRRARRGEHPRPAHRHRGPVAPGPALRPLAGLPRGAGGGARRRRVVRLAVRLGADHRHALRPRGGRRAGRGAPTGRRPVRARRELHGVGPARAGCGAATAPCNASGGGRGGVAPAPAGWDPGRRDSCRQRLGPRQGLAGGEGGQRGPGRGQRAVAALQADAVGLAVQPGDDRRQLQGELGA